MPLYSRNKDFNAFIRDLLSAPEWEFDCNGKSKHAFLLHRPSGRKLPVPSSPKGDPAGFENFKSAVRRIIREYQQTLEKQQAA